VEVGPTYNEAEIFQGTFPGYLQVHSEQEYLPQLKTKKPNNIDCYV